tara:strand:+ start:352 stop:1467 length:1116 start_codon:yes stop_codon:yes gene_type:complete
MPLLFHGDCLEEMKQLEDDSVDLVFCDLPYGQTSCKWDCKIDLKKFWIEIMRIKKINTPIFFTTTTKFGVDLIQSAPKKCFFRYDLVWVKSAPAGFLSAKKMPMRKHEMVYVFYEKLPLYDLSSHTHKFIKEVPTKRAGKDNVDNKGMIKNRSKSGMETITKYNPPLPVSVLKEEKMNSELYGELPTTDSYAESIGIKKADKHKVHYEPPLPTSVVKEEKNSNKNSELYGELKDNGYYHLRKNGETTAYEPPLPVSVVKEPEHKWVKGTTDIYGGAPTEDSKECGGHQQRYNPPLPTTMLEIKSTRGKHSTEKPVALMEWILKYYSKEGDVVLDPTMGSGSTGVACKNMNREFIGIEMDGEIFEGACNRLD